MIKVQNAVCNAGIPLRKKCGGEAISMFCLEDREHMPAATDEVYEAPEYDNAKRQKPGRDANLMQSR